MSSQSKFESYRILQSRIGQPSLFDEGRSDGEIRTEVIRSAVYLGTKGAPGRRVRWVAGAIQELEEGIMFKLGVARSIRNFRFDDGNIEEFEAQVTTLTDVLIQYGTGFMLIRNDASTPSPFLASRVFQRWLSIENESRGTGLDSLVRPIRQVDEFVAELESAHQIIGMTFVVRGPNPEDESDFVQQIAQFTEVHGIRSTTVTINAGEISQETAKGVTAAVSSVGDKVSARITDAQGTERTIRPGKKTSEVSGPASPSPHDAPGLFAKLRAIVDKHGVRTRDGS